MNSVLALRSCIGWEEAGARGGVDNREIVFQQPFCDELPGFVDDRLLPNMVYSAWDVWKVRIRVGHNYREIPRRHCPELRLHPFFQSTDREQPVQYCLFLVRPPRPGWEIEEEDRHSELCGLQVNYAPPSPLAMVVVGV